uniref:SAM-dependent MTase TRM10-type domain-containing protein n=1 Tax=Panagrolaimus sp. JU765 TaxID=591449 RepID=A0AC34QJN8_9BILA
SIFRHLGSLENPRNLGVIVSDQNYTDLFEKDKIVYLSPDSDEVLEKVEPDMTYVIGAIVDRVPERNIPAYASLEASQADQIKAYRLPLDEYIDWKSGTRFLTLLTVMKILQMNYENDNNWKKTLET